jgi:hypothetical protein
MDDVIRIAVEDDGPRADGAIWRRPRSPLAEMQPGIANAEATSVADRYGRPESTPTAA